MSSAVLGLLIAQMVMSAIAAPHIQAYRQDPNVAESSTPCNNGTGEDNDVYDQRQNGTENYRINVNGVVVLLAPPEAILAAANFPNIDETYSSTKPPKVTTVRPVVPESSVTPTVDACEGGKCNITNPAVKQQRGKLKMMNNLLQIFRNLRDDSHHE